MSLQPAFERPAAALLLQRLREPRRRIIVAAGPRQVGKTTAVLQVLEQLARSAHYATADDPGLHAGDWIAQQWAIARDKLRASDGSGGEAAVATRADAPAKAGSASSPGAVLVLDEIQKLAGWSETVKRLWDADTRNDVPLHVVILGSSPLLVERGLTESLAGRFEIMPMSHWSFGEMRSAFGWDWERFVLYGGYPGTVPFVDDHVRWARYVLDALVETTVSRDILLMARVDKPALLRQLFELGCAYSGQILSFNKMVGQLADAGNTTTLANYLRLLSGAGLLSGLQKHSRRAVRSRASSPKLLVRNTALMTAMSRLDPQRLRAEPETWGRWVETACGAHLVNATAGTLIDVEYWRDDRGQQEVDFVLTRGRDTVGIEIKSGRGKGVRSGLDAFERAFKPRRTLLVGDAGIPVEEFLLTPPEHWFGD